ncbi:MAG: type III-B CRISPR module RAMP protein Cmr1 [Beggiatoa sp. IS2]|nr:MAG: type III-B CRISPR module RAMP protein Cmr1 [Beggiatoa sp. IS2]
MRLRPLPKDALLPDDVKAAPSVKKTFEVELITPLYGGGVEAGQPDTEMPIRVSAIRGQLRFWWRLLNPRRNLQDETEIWGGISETEATASKVILRINDMPKSEDFEKKSCAEFKKFNPESKEKNEKKDNPLWKKGAGYVLGIQNDLSSTSLLVPKKGRKIDFKLELRVVAATKGERQHIWDYCVLPALRWWASFGGLGARTRRGLGSVKIADLVPVTEEEAKKVDCKLVIPKPDASDHDATKAWTMAIGKLQQFRQGVGVGRDSGPSRSRWPEADSIREITGRYPIAHTPIHPAKQSFPRAVFGLPIITDFMRDTEPPKTTLYPVVENDKKEDEKRDRMASPLILKAMWTGKDYQSIALLLPHDIDMGLCLLFSSKDDKNCRNNLLPTEVRGDWWPKEKRDAMTGAKDNPLSGRTGDILQDFLNFFQEK